MKTYWIKKWICFIMGILLFFHGVVTDINVSAMETSQENNRYLYPFEEAVEELERLAGEKEIPAVVYLEDTIYLRALPEEGSEPIAEVVSGESIRIIGVGQDSSYNIWYLVSRGYEEEEISGYLPQENVACVEEEFIHWEESYVRSIGRSSQNEKGYDDSDVQSFPKSYQGALLELKKKHPSWIFVKMNTGIDWMTLVRSQIGERSLVYAPSSPENWKNGMYGTTKWAYATEAVIKYFIDPRNWLSEKNIFQFELLGYSADYHTIPAVQNVLTNSFMATGLLENKKTYAETFVELGRTTGVSPFLMATRVRQEQGITGTSDLISGTYNGYEGYYNYYNIGASGKTDEEVIVNGLKKAKEEGWNTRVKSLTAGAAFLGGSYISAGQDTLYLQKFDVDYRTNGVFWHQYMQNIQAPSTEASKVQQAYQKSGLLEEAFIFRIPVYENMPSSASVLPGQEDKITLSSSQITDLQIGSEITLRPYINGKEIEGMEWSFLSSDESIATVDEYGVVKGISEGNVTITCRKKEDMSNTIEGSCKVTIVKAELDLTTLEMPKLDAVTYDPKLVLKDIELPEGYQWLNPEMVPVVSQEKYGVSYNPDQKKYKDISFDITLIVNKALPKYEIPKDLEGGAGRELRSVALPQGFFWKNPEEILSKRIGKLQYQAGYNPDNYNYETVENISLTVNIICEEHEFGEWEITNPSCDKEGSKQRNCKICDKKEEMTLEAAGHQYSITQEEEATEKKEGKRVYICEICEDSYMEQIPKLPLNHEHNYEKEVIKKASCLQDGLVKFVCSCDDSYQEIIDATGHEIEGNHCISCGYSEIISPPQGETGGSKPEKEEKPKEETKPKEEEKPKEETKPKEEEKPKEETKPKEEEKPKEETKPKEEEKPKEETKPKEEEKPKEETKPKEEEKSLNQNSQDKSGGNATSIDQSQYEKTQEKKEQILINQDLPEESQKEQEKKSQEYVEVDLMSLLVENTEEKPSDKENKKENIVLQLNKNTGISEQILKMAKSYGVNLEVNLRDGISWEIVSESVREDLVQELDMNVEVVNNVIPKSLIEKIKDRAGYTELHLSHEGEFGLDAYLKLPVEEKYQGMVANLFYYNPELNQLEYRMDTKVTEKNEILLQFSHASDYLILFTSHSMAENSVIQNHKEEEVEKEVLVEEMKKTSSDRLLIFTGITMVCSIALIVTGFLLRRKESEEILNHNKKKTLEKEYFDEDIDDYREKEIQEYCSIKQEEHQEEEYFDEDIDDYVEKENMNFYNNMKE